MWLDWDQVPPAVRRTGAAPRDLTAFEATRQACAMAGWEYRLAGAPDPIATANLLWRECRIPAFAPWVCQS